jgi:thiamine biosynthesis lipoprotein
MATSLVERLPVDERVAQWTVWSTVARVVVTDPAARDAARAVVRRHVDAVDRACSRFRPDSEIHRLYRAGGRPITVSPLLAELVATALAAAEHTDGDVDPTVANRLADLGYDRDISQLPTASGQGSRRDLCSLPVRGGARVPVRARAVPGWRSVQLDGRRLSAPPGVGLDLGATAKAWTADRAAADVATQLGVGVLVSLGGDLATAGPNPDGWRILVQDRPGDPARTVAIPAGAALATSSTTGRGWQLGRDVLHHILDPRTGLPARTPWRTASVAAFSCVRANACTTAALVRGERAHSWLTSLGLPARLISQDGTVLTVAGWPPETRSAPPATVPPATVLPATTGGPR